jgi:hypothetical protein
VPIPDACIAEAVAHSKYKIEWAKQHINEAEALVDATVAENTNVVNIDNDTGAPYARVLIGPNQRIPVNIPLHVGDAVHALNSVMDFLWSGLARSVTPDLGSKVTFPRHETRKNLEAVVNDDRGYNAAIHKAFPEARSFVLEVVKSYKTSDCPSYIWRLNKLDNINKHRLLITTPYVISFARDLVLQGSDGGRFVQAAGVAVQTQGHPLSVGLTPPVKLQEDPQPKVAIVFGEPDHFTGQSVVETLVNLVEATSKVVDEFEKAFVRIGHRRPPGGISN